MSYKHLDQIQSLYESVSEIDNNSNELLEDIVTVVSTSMFVEGYSTTAIRGYLEYTDPIQIAEKYIGYAESFSFVDEKTLNEDVDLEYEIDQESLEALNLVISEGLASWAVKGLRKIAAPTMRAIGKGGRKNIKNAISAVKNKVGIGVKNVSTKADDVAKTTGKWVSGKNPIKPVVTKSGGIVKTAKTNVDKVVKSTASKVDDVVKNVKTAAKTPKATAKNALSKTVNFVKKQGPLAGALAVGGYLGGKLSGDSKDSKADTVATDVGDAVSKGQAELDKYKKKVEQEATPKSDTSGDVGKAAGKVAAKVVAPPKPTNPSGKELPKAKEVKKGSTRERMINKNIDIHGKDKVDKLRSKNAAFHAARKKGSGYSMDDFVKDFPNSNTAKERAKRNRVTSVMDMESVQHSGETVEDVNEIFGTVAKKAASVVSDKAKTLGSKAKTLGSKIKSKVADKVDRVKNRKHYAKAKADTSSPAAKSGLDSDTRAKAAIKHDAWQKANKRGKYRESYDAFDIVSNYLIDSNQVENMDEALYVMTEMDAQTIQGIVEDFKKKA